VRLRHGLLLVLLAARPATGQAATTCVPGWSPPIPVLDSLGRPTYLEPGALLYLRGRILALSNPVMQWLETDRMFDTAKLDAIRGDTAIAKRHFLQGGAWIDARGTANLVPRPHLEANLIRPVAAVGRGEVVDVLYGVEGASGSANRLEYDRFDSNRWEGRQAILDGQFIWGPQAPFVTRGDSLVFAVTDANRQNPAFRLIMRAGSRWREAAVPVTSLQRKHATAAFNRRGQPVVVFIGDTVSGHDALYATTILRWDSTAAWSTPVALDRDSSMFAYAMSIIPLGGDSLVLAFERQRGYSGHETVSIASMLSTDGGTSWSASDSIPITSHGARFIKDSIGVVHVVYMANDASVLLSPGRVMHSMWRGGKWSTPTPAAQEEASTQPTIVATPTGIATIWGQADQMLYRGKVEMEPRSYIAYWTRCR
jgi:hypothetical protein